MTSNRYRIRITLEGPVLTAATNPGARGVDTPFARNGDGLLCFPGTLIKGKLLQAWDVLGNLSATAGLGLPVPKQEQAKGWLGREGGNEENQATAAEKYLPARGRAVFSDLVDTSAGSDCGRTRTRIAMDEQLRSADEGALQIMESPYRAGAPAIFEGFVDFWPEDATAAKLFGDAVRLGLAAIPSFGAERGVGFGRLRCAVVEQVEQPRWLSGAMETGIGKRTFGLTLTTSDPLCFAKPHPAMNLFETAEVVSGAVLKGVVAEMMGWHGGAFPRLKQHLSRMRFRHARPAEKDAPLAIPPAIPLSAVVYGDSVLADVALEGEGQAHGLTPPAFRPDWKHPNWQAARKRFGTPQLPTELRLRTSIDRDKRRAKDANLFGYESILPKGFRWLTNVDLFHVPEGERGPLLQELQDLLRNGLFGVGKNKARVEVEASTSIPGLFESRPIEAGEKLVLQLHTPALLGVAGDWQFARTADHVREIYRKVWSALDPRLVLTNYFAQQEMAGGQYLHRRFRGGQYQPWLLTSAGSVFVFAPPPLELQKVLDKWLLTGLPVGDDERVSYDLGTDPFAIWLHCPYVPENGFGEIGVNLHRNWPELTAEVNHA